ncbi:TfoX/Sxy family protein [Sansalvadorimonas verongulae]|uniref:TfoX/Sxy family protein n=1 Tax=Sansalvadorimonas verongulae TaxID=2172824 RepID=UPI0012BD57A4|nr:TfoX/Sxy family protein [Sansalvadorimonas verongulae]MTI13617.1 competence protein TfoX [Sansalvadorimonas verongulae]
MELIEMKNLGKTSVQWLNAVGIHSPEQLKQAGAAAAYRKVKARGFRVSKVLLYALEGALLDTHWSELSQEHKDRLLKDVENPPE